MRFDDLQVAKWLLELNGVPVDPMIDEIPHDYAISLLEPELLKCLDFSSTVEPVFMDYFDRLSAEIDSLSPLTRDAVVIEFNETFWSGPTFNSDSKLTLPEMPAFEVFLMLKHMKIRGGFITGRSVVKDQAPGEYWPEHAFWDNKFSLYNSRMFFSSVETVFLTSPAAHAEVMQPDGSKITWIENLEPYFWFQQQVHELKLDGDNE